MQPVSKQRLGKDVPLRQQRGCVFCVLHAEGLYKGQRRSFKPVEFRDASLPEYELGSRGTELRNCGLRSIECSGVESLAAKKILYVCYSTAIFETCNLVRLLKSVARKWLVETDGTNVCGSEL
jgi:hypothetical protein